MVVTAGLFGILAFLGWQAVLRVLKQRAALRTFGRPQRTEVPEAAG
jgi:hypothetical protein